MCKPSCLSFIFCGIECPVVTDLLKERVMIRYPFNIGKKAPKRRVAIAGTIIARNIPLSKYNVKYRNPDTMVVEKEWVEVTDVISLTHKKRVPKEET